MGECKEEFAIFLIFDDCTSMLYYCEQKFHLISLIKIGKEIKYLYCGLVEKAMAPHSSTLAWKILWTEEPGRLQSMGSLRVGHN